MSDDDVQPAVEEKQEKAPAKRKRRPSKTSSTPKPKIKDMVEEAINATYDARNGASLQAIKKYLSMNFGLEKPTYIRSALKRGVASGDFIQVKGVGASGSFKVNSTMTDKAAEKTRRQKDSEQAKMAKSQKTEKEAQRIAKRMKKAQKERESKKESPPKAAKKIKKVKPEKRVKTPAKKVEKKKKKSVKKSPKKAKRGSAK
ncbi:histone H1.1-like [Asterias amurensis]|uniref:histone H1.1-like n=1 Tax=Asterias amurensis TaxID=7602 RepID=UPI003AB54A46